MNLPEHIARSRHRRQPRAEQPNPLATGTFCRQCGTRLDKPERECPMCDGGAA